MSDDARLEAYFVSLRREDATQTPGFERVLGRGRQRFAGHSWVLAIAASLVCAAVVVTVYRGLHPLRSPAFDAAAPALAEWRSPTDFLLETPGRELLRTVPGIGNSLRNLRLSFPPIYPTTPAQRADGEHT
jgi:hypothetical protein